MSREKERKKETSLEKHEDRGTERNIEGMRGRVAKIKREREIFEETQR